MLILGLKWITLFTYVCPVTFLVQLASPKLSKFLTFPGNLILSMVYDNVSFCSFLLGLQMLKLKWKRNKNHLIGKMLNNLNSTSPSFTLQKVVH